MLRNKKALELLVVEDNPGDVLLLKEYLHLGQVPINNILEAESIAAIPSALDNKDVDLAFLDLSLPDSEGINTFTYLNNKLPHTPIIILTGLSDINVALEALSLGAQDYVMKNDFNEKLLSKAVRYSIERKRAEEKMQQMNEELRSLSAHLLNIREEERARIAREIHDELGQQITGLKMDVSWLSKKLSGKDIMPIVKDKLSDMSALLDDTVHTVRKIASELRPSLLDDIGLVAALDWQSNEFKKRFDIPVHFTSEREELKIDPAIATGLFRMYQETLTNVARHAHATKVESSLGIDNENIILTIADNGKGFDASNIKNRKTLGLLGMKERAIIIGGILDIKSDPKKGTTVIISVPIHKK
jgi:signal transduction histidine kinase